LAPGFRAWTFRSLTIWKKQSASNLF
jgi:hypothetical protein